MKLIILFLLIDVLIIGCNPRSDKNQTKIFLKEQTMTNTSLDTIVLGGGCFWCVEAIYDRVKGVEKVISGYSGGDVENPTYSQVCSGNTGHAEVCQIIYDSSIVSVDELLKIFFSVHDPTTLNRQGADEGTQYRSVIFYLNESQKEKAEFYKHKLDNAGIYSSKIVTEISKFGKFYSAEEYHQDYYENNSNQGYCKFVIQPKVEKFEKIFAEQIKSK